MKKIARAALALILVAGIVLPVRADTAAGSTPFDFLLLDADARAVGLAGAYTALATDANALLYNPGGLAPSGAPQQATFMHNQYVQGLVQEYAGWNSGTGWGINFNYLNFGGVTRTTLSQPNGTLGTTGLYDLSVAAGYGALITENLSAGLGVKYIRENIDDVAKPAYAADFGALYKVSRVPGFTLGASLLNLGPTVRFQSADESLPTTMRLGGAYAFAPGGQKTTFAADISKTVYDQFRFGLGAETLLFDAMAVRFGFTNRNDAGMGITVGVGWVWKNLSADYAFVPMGDLGDGHRISVSWRWGQPKPKPAPLWK